MIENFVDRNKDGNADGGYHGILSLVDAIETENYRPATILAGPLPDYSQSQPRTGYDRSRIRLVANA